MGSSIMDKWFGMDPPKTPARPDPLPKAEVEDPEDIIKRLRKRSSGRADTILAGDLMPMDIGKRTLLG